MNCKYCGHTHIYKRGKRNGKQRYQCGNCNKYFQDDYSYNAYKEGTNDWIVKLIKNSCGIMDISRILETAPKTVLSRMLKLSKPINAQSFIKDGCDFEIDEMSIKIANVKKQN